MSAAESPDTTQVSELNIAVDADQLAATLYCGAQPREAVLFIHGWNSSQLSGSQYAAALAAEGRVCLTFDLRGHGDSDGDAEQQSRADFLADVLAAYDTLAATAPDDVPIVVIGASFGGYLAALLTQQRAVSRLVLRVPADYPDESFKLPTAEARSAERLEAWRQLDRGIDSTAALRAVAEFAGDVLVIESLRDEQIPPEVIANYVQAADAEHVTMDAPHNVGFDPELRAEYECILREHLAFAD